MNPRSFYRQRPLVVIAFAFGLGVAMGGRWLNPEPAWPLAGCALSLLLVVLSKCSARTCALGVAFLCLFLGIWRASVVANPPLPPQGEYQITAVVSGLSERRESDGRVKAVLRKVRLSDAQGRRYSVSAAYWTYYPAARSSLLEDGQSVSLQGRLYYPSPQQNPSGFDFRMYLLQRGIPVGISGARDLSYQGADAPANLFLRLRLTITGAIERVFGTSAPLLAALLMGERDNLPEETAQVFRDTGIAHVLAVSGLHVGILVSALGIVLRLLRLSHKAQLAVIAGFVLCYAALLDFAAPVVRAAILGILLLGGPLLHERSDPLTSLSAAFLLILAVRPLDLYSVGFQLSFSAVLGICLTADRLNARFFPKPSTKRTNAFIRGVARTLITTAGATLGTAPLVALYFYQVPLIGLVLSPIACLLVAWLMVYAIPALLLGAFFPAAAGVLAMPADWLSGLLTGLTRIAASLDLGLLRTSAPSLMLVGGVFAVIFFSSRYCRMKGRLRFSLMALAILLPLGAAWAASHSQVTYIQLSAGSADAAVIEDGRNTYVIDAGTHGGDLAGYLLSRGRRVDTLYLTHLHNDHAGGLAQLLKQRVPIEEIVLPYGARDAQIAPESLALLDMAEKSGISVRYVGVGYTMQGERVSMRVLWPFSEQVYPHMDANHTSLAMLWDLDGVTLLTAGDLSSAYELYAAHPAQILKVAHHGSKYSTSAAYLQAVNPQVALLSTAQTTLVRATAVLKRLEDAGCRVISTHERGAITLQPTPEGLQVKQYISGGIQ